MPGARKIITRFAPSPSGYLHLGHAYSAFFAWDQARAAGGECLLRIEDIDLTRCKLEFEQAIQEDLAWLGLEWPTTVLRQSDRFDAYQDALDKLQEAGLIYPCFCTRKEIAAEIVASGAAPHGPAGIIYPGTCRGLSEAEQQDRMDRGQGYALRLNVRAAMEQVGEVRWHDMAYGDFALDLSDIGDVVLARKDIPTSYHLAVVIDDAATGVNLVTRGEDLLLLTHIQVLLHALLGTPVPDYHHHRVILGPDGKRFAKRDQSVTLRALREAGHTPEDMRQMVAGSAFELR